MVAQAIYKKRSSGRAAAATGYICFESVAPLFQISRRLSVFWKMLKTAYVMGRTTLKPDDRVCRVLRGPRVSDRVQNFSGHKKMKIFKT